jgi:hypothetical protein
VVAADLRCRASQPVPGTERPRVWTSSGAYAWVVACEAPGPAMKRWSYGRPHSLEWPHRLITESDNPDAWTAKSSHPGDNSCVLRVSWSSGQMSKIALGQHFYGRKSVG